jgi:hypothetical protein
MICDFVLVLHADGIFVAACARTQPTQKIRANKDEEHGKLQQLTELKELDPQRPCHGSAFVAYS